MLVLSLDEAVKCTLVCSVHWCGYVLIRVDGHVMRRGILCVFCSVLRRVDGHVMRRGILWVFCGVCWGGWMVMSWEGGFFGYSAVCVEEGGWSCHEKGDSLGILRCVLRRVNSHVTRRGILWVFCCVCWGGWMVMSREGGFFGYSDVCVSALYPCVPCRLIWYTLGLSILHAWGWTSICSSHCNWNARRRTNRPAVFATMAPDVFSVSDRIVYVCCTACSIAVCMCVVGCEQCVPQQYVCVLYSMPNSNVCSTICATFYSCVCVLCIAPYSSVYMCYIQPVVCIVLYIVRSVSAHGGCV